MQSVINFGAPINYNGTRYASANDRVSEQLEIVFEF